MMIKLAIGGSRGRMGQRLIALAQPDDRFNITAQFDIDESSSQEPFDVLVDFSSAQGTAQFLSACRTQHAGFVTGTTGLEPSQQDEFKKAAAEIPVLVASNFSLGINLLLSFLPEVARKLDRYFDMEIVETHHTQKVDAPSGTALTLLDTLLQSTKRSRENDVVFGRHGQVGSKQPRQIGVHAVRSGEVVGRHQIIFGGVGESITLTHEAHSRDTFAKGALEAAAWISGKPPGLYTMQDVLAGR